MCCFLSGFFDIEESKVGLLGKDGCKMLTQCLLVICWILQIVNPSRIETACVCASQLEAI